MDENYADAEFSVEALCDSLHISPAYFSTIFKKEAGINFISYLTDVRMKEAMRLLDETDEKNIHDCGKGGIFGAELFQLCIQEAGRSIPLKIPQGT